VAPFTVTKHLVNDGLIRLAVAGEVDLSTSEALRHIIVNALTVDRVAELIVDLDAVTFMDSSAIAALVQGRATALEYGTTYRVINPCGRVHRVLHITGALDALTGDGGLA
jgi:anti-anti-sigma factor